MDEVTPEYLESLRTMTGEEKVRAAISLYWGARKVKAARLRELHPEWSEERVQDEVKRIFLHAVT